MRSFQMLISLGVSLALLAACAAPRRAPKAGPDPIVTSPYDNNTSNDVPEVVITPEVHPPPPPTWAAPKPETAKPKPPLALSDLIIKLPKGWTVVSRADNGDWYGLEISKEAVAVTGMAVVSVGDFKVPLDGCQKAKANAEANRLVADEIIVDPDGSCRMHATEARQGLDTYSRYLVLPGHPEVIASVGILYPNHLDAKPLWRDVDGMAKSLADKSLKAKHPKK